MAVGKQSGSPPTRANFEITRSARPINPPLARDDRQRPASAVSSHSIAEGHSRPVPAEAGASHCRLLRRFTPHAGERGEPTRLTDAEGVGVLQSQHGLSVAKAPHVYRCGTEPVKPGKALDAREMAEMPETVGLGETV